MGRDLRFAIASGELRVEINHGRHGKKRNPFRFMGVACCGLRVENVIVREADVAKY